MATAIFLQALRDYARPNRLLPWVLVAAFCAFLAFMIGVANRHFGIDPADVYTAISNGTVMLVLGLAAAIYATANVSGEVEQKTIVYLLTRPVPRGLLLVMRFLAASIVVFAIAALCDIVVSLVAFGPHANPMLARDILTCAFGSLAYCGFFTLLSLMLNRAMIYCILIAFIWEPFVPQLPGTMYYVSVVSYLHAFANHPLKTGGRFLEFLAASLGTNTISPSVALIVLLLMPVGAIALGSWWFTQFEYVPREDVV